MRYIKLIAGLLMWCSLFLGSCIGWRTKRTLPSYYQPIKSSSVEDALERVEEELKIVRLMDKSNPLSPLLRETITFRFGNEVYGNKLIQQVSEADVSVFSFSSYKMVSFFPRSSFQIEDDMKSAASKVFKPMVDSIFLAASQLSEGQFIAKVIVSGYSDGVAIKEGSPTYAQLSKKMKDMPLSSHTMNSFLSYLRALAVADIIRELFLARSNELKSFKKVYIEILSEGKGEALPETKKKFRIDDERRRIVKLHWFVPEK